MYAFEAQGVLSILFIDTVFLRTLQSARHIPGINTCWNEQLTASQVSRDYFLKIVILKISSL